jgi:hypothetical protein
VLYLNAHPDERCPPSVEALRSEKFLDSAFMARDQWGNPFVIECSGDDIVVSTAGPDRTPGTQDDIVVPPL